MAKLNHRVLPILLMLLMAQWAAAQALYPVQYRVIDSSRQAELSDLKKEFPSKAAAIEYVYKLPTTLQTEGFIPASIDSMQFDSLQAVVDLFLGARYQWAQITTLKSDEDILGAVRWNLFAYTVLQAGL